MHARKMNDIGNAHTANGDIRKTWKKQNVATMDAQRETEPEKKTKKIHASNMNTTTPFPRVIISIFVASVYGTGTVSLFIISKSLAPANGWPHIQQCSRTPKRNAVFFPYSFAVSAPLLDSIEFQIKRTAPHHNPCSTFWMNKKKSKHCAPRSPPEWEH